MSLERSLDVVEVLSKKMQSYKVDTDRQIDLLTTTLSRSIEQSAAAEKMAVVDTSFEQHSQRLDALNTTIGRSLDVTVVALTNQMQSNKVNAEAALVSAEQRLSANISSVAARTEKLSHSLQSLKGQLASTDTSFDQQSRQIDALNVTFGRSLHAVSEQMLNNKVDTSWHIDLMNASLVRSLDVAVVALSHQMQSNKLNTEGALINAEQRLCSNISSVTAQAEKLGRSLQSLTGKLALVDTSFEQQSRQIGALNTTIGRSLHAVSEQMLNNKVDTTQHINLLNASLVRSLDASVIALSHQMQSNKVNAEAALVSAEQRLSTNMSSVVTRAAAAAEADKIRTTMLAKQIEDITTQLTHFAPATSVAQVRSSLETVHHAVDDLSLRVQGDIGTFNASLQRMSVAADLDRARLMQYLSGMTAVESRLDTLDGRIGRTVFNLTFAIESLSRQLHTDTTASAEGIAKSLDRLVTLETALNGDRSAATQSWKRLDDRTNVLEASSKGLEVAVAASKGQWADVSDRVDQLVHTLTVSNRTVTMGMGDIHTRFAAFAAQAQAQDAVHTHSASMQTVRLDNLTDRMSHGRDLLSRVQAEVGALSVASNETTAALLRHISAGQNLSARVSILESTLPLRLDADKAQVMPAELKDLRATVDRVVLEVQAIARGDVTFLGGVRSAFVSLINAAIVLAAVLYFVISTLCIGKPNATHPMSTPVEGAEATTTALQNQEDVDVAEEVAAAEEALKAQFEVLEASHQKLAKSLKSAVTASKTKMAELSHRLDRAVDVAHNTRQQDNNARQQEIAEEKNASLAEVTLSYISPHMYQRVYVYKPLITL